MASHPSHQEATDWMAAYVATTDFADNWLTDTGFATSQARLLSPLGGDTGMGIWEPPEFTLVPFVPILPPLDFAPSTPISQAMEDAWSSLDTLEDAQLPEVTRLLPLDFSSMAAGTPVSVCPEQLIPESKRRRGKGKPKILATNTLWNTGQVRHVFRIFDSQMGVGCLFPIRYKGTKSFVVVVPYLAYMLKILFGYKCTLTTLFAQLIELPGYKGSFLGQSLRDYTKRTLGFPDWKGHTMVQNIVPFDDQLQVWLDDSNAPVCAPPRALLTPPANPTTLFKRTGFMTRPFVWSGYPLQAQMEHNATHM